MQFLHAQTPPIVHRDLKSHNLLIDAKWRVKLCDFGLVTTKYVTAGTPQYLAPELMQAKPYSRKVDVYAFGILIWEVLARRVPFNGWKPTDIVAHVTSGKRPDTSASTFGLEADAVTDLKALMERCWAHEPAERPEFSELVQLLDVWKPRQSAMARATNKLGGGDALDSMLGGGSSRARRK
jgi:serine/threonine protein kinase